jgi:uncharacterized surface protein with fasciclin (FAS1) repeats
MRELEMTRRSILAIGATGIAVLLTGCASAVSRGPRDIWGTLNTRDEFSTLAAAIDAADLEDTLEGPGPITLFAPTNTAFEALPAGTVETLLLPENKARLVQVLTYHAYSGAVSSAQLLGKVSRATTIEGGRLRIDGRGGRVLVNDATVIEPDIEATNGIVHGIDRVLIPA